ncbi:hypothetical protein F5Y18DRAFT_388681 [Xylariaceae sp. FL1019]|nr:hypothetical protein F5Y18DRAFT_388681 [Xylariaceae sp. FL1019]
MGRRSSDPFVDWIPYEPNGDVLDGHISYDDVRIQDIPPTQFDDSPDAPQDIAPPGSSAGANDMATAEVRSELIKSLNDETYGGYSPHWWLTNCRYEGLRIDVNRLLRFAICRASGLFWWLTNNKLCNEPGIDYARLDIMGRSPIFYALWPYRDEDMLGKMIGMLEDGRSMTQNLLRHQDRNGAGLMHYAIRLKGLAAIEFLLATTQACDIRSAHEFPYPNELHWNEEHLISVLFRGKPLLEELPTSHGGCFSDQDAVFTQLKSQLSKEDDYQLTWLHLPRSYGATIFSLLRRLSRESYSFQPAADTHVSVVNMAGDPYTESRYVSNLGISSLPFGRQVYMVFPILILQSKWLWISKESTYKYWKEGHDQTFVRSAYPPDRTLDESYFPSLSDQTLKHRNDSQVVTRELERQEHSEMLIIVPNLWVWRCGQGILTTYSTGSWSWDLEPDIWMTDASGVRENSHWSPGIQVATLIAQHVSHFGVERYDAPPTLDIFERAVVQILQEVDDYIGPKSTLRPEMGKERDFMFRIADIREELVMILAILEQQLELVERMIEDFEKNDPDIKKLRTAQFKELDGELREANKAWEKVRNTPNVIEKYRKRAKKIDADAERVEKMIQNQLNLKRTYASIEDARTSLLLGTAVIGFTVITVIFAPLAFMTALFALPVDVLVRNQFLFDPSSADSSSSGQADPIPTYPSRYVGGWFFFAEVVSLFVTGALVWICLRLFGGKEISTVLKDRVSDTMKGLNRRVENSAVADVATGFARGRKGLRDGAAKLLQRPNRRQNRTDQV